MCTALAIAALLAIGQAATGPVAPTPKQTTTLNSLATALASYLKDGADDKLWIAADPQKRAELVEITWELNEQIQQVVGPVAPRPKPKPAPGIGPKKSEWDDQLKQLQDALKGATKSNPTKVLPADAAANARSLLEALSKGKS